MSFFLRKIRGGSPNHVVPPVAATRPSQPRTPSTTTQSHHTPLLLITPQVEQLYLQDLGPAQHDPLVVQPQFVKTLKDILNSPAALPYFLQFLQSWGADKYARFWLDANSFRAAASVRISNQDLQVPRDNSDVLPGDNTLRFNEKNVRTVVGGENRTCSVKSTRHKESQFKVTPTNPREKGLILPDLVSNIQDTGAVTPLSSPEGPCTTLLSSPATHTGTGQCTGEHVTSHIIPQPDEEDNTTCRNLQNKVLGDQDTSGPSASGCSRNTRLRQNVAEDSMRIYKKYLAENAEHSIVLDEANAKNILQIISVDDEDIDEDCFLPAQQIVSSILETEFLPKFLASDYYLKHQIDVLTSGSVRLADIIYSDSAFPYFMEYVEQEGGRELLQVWVAVANFRQQLIDTQGSYDPMEAQTDAMILYDKYFSLQATCPVGFSDRVRFIVEGNICREDGPLPSCFDLPLRIVLHVLEQTFLGGYMSSSLHIKYLGELINTVKTSIELLGRKKRSGSESTCSSEVSSSCGGTSISTHNTLLAMDSSASSHRFRHLDDPSIAMRIDESQLTDPDSLWRRKNFSKLSCGFINELGKFHSELELEPDRKVESRISRTLRKFVNMDEDKVKEDMAYKVAEMIIKDVTSVTLGPQHTPAPAAPPLSPAPTTHHSFTT